MSEKAQLPPSEGLFPVPVILVSCLDKKTQKTNIITIAWCGVVCSTPPLISISIRPGRHSHGLIKDTGDFVINIPSAALLKKADLCGVISGRDTDKFKASGLTKKPSAKIASPAIEECPVNIECKLRDTVKLGSHDLFIGEVVNICADKEILAKDGRIDCGKVNPFVYALGEYWGLSKKIGCYGCSGK